jgi:hypothetical protein
MRSTCLIGSIASESSADEAIARHHESQGPICAVSDPYAGRGFDLKRRFLAKAAHLQWAFYQIRAVELARDAHRERQFARAGCQVFHAPGDRTAAVHGSKARQRLQRPDQNAARHAHRLSDKIQTFIHAVNEVDISVAGRAEDDARAIGNAAPGVGSAIADTEICFHFHDSSRRAAVDQDFSKAVTRDIRRRPRVEIAVEERGAG